MNSPPPLDQLPVTRLKGVGKGIAARLARLGIATAQDLLFHLPLRYEDRTRITPIGALRQGNSVLIEGTVAASSVVFARRRSLLTILQDGTGSVSMRLFHFSRAQQNNLTAGRRVRCYGEVRRGASGFELYHPEYRVLPEGQNPPLDDRYTPIYPTTAGVTQARLRALVLDALALLREGRGLPEFLPATLPGIRALPALVDAVRYVHQPPIDAPLDLLLERRHPCQQRLAFEELLAHHLSLLRLRAEVRSLRAHPVVPARDRRGELLATLPFALTPAQVRVSREIARDMTRDHPMLRLLQGDVGSGKTIVAALASIDAASAGLQTAIMAPTELLAEQHLATFRRWLTPIGIQCAWLSGTVKGRERRERLAQIAEGSAHVVIGTHALFQESVQFARLGLTVIDEQHRFGVYQRLALRNKSAGDACLPHQLILTATPIPRTLAMSIYADLDCSVIDELPRGRKPVSTSVVAETRRDEVVDRVRHACAAGRQAYWVCTTIDESELVESRAAETTAAFLADALPGLRVGLIHGRLPAAKRSAVMREFKEGAIDLLVATTVIEVGVDVPNASLMIIENAERLGLAQLHQLRGRIGRGSDESHCVLMYHAPLSEIGRQRLAVLRESTDGFRIAEEDLRMRGPGEVLGTRQTGAIEFRIADLMRDGHLLDQVKRVASDLLRADPQAASGVVDRWLKLGKQFGQV